MKATIRFAILVTTSLCGFTAAPTQGADGTLAPDRPHVPVGAADHWRLRPTVPVTIVAERAPRAALPVPEVRRNVRLVYPALVEAK